MTKDEAERVQRQIERLERAVTTMAWWLVQTQSGFGERDARAITDIIEGRK